MKRIYPAFCMFMMLGLHTTPGYSQNEDFMQQFKQARSAMMNDYDKFRSSVLADYDQYLEGVWKEYKHFQADKTPARPKPKEPPVYQEPPVEEEPVKMEPKNVEPKPVEPVTVEPENIKPQPFNLPLSPVFSSMPVMPALPNIGPLTIPVSKETVEMDFYGEKIQMQKATRIPAMNITTSDDVATYWKQLKKSDLQEVVPSLAAHSRQMGLSDWATAMFVEKYAEAVMPEASRNEKLIAVQYILANSGYNIRLGMNESTVVLLVPYIEHVYEQSYIIIDDKRYYTYPEIESDGIFRSCELPKNSETGKDIELKFAGHTAIGDESKEFNYQADGITLTGKVKTGIMSLLDQYPIIDIPVVASSVIDKQLRQQVVKQIKAQVQGLDEQTAANKILHFIQHAFKYATDAEQFNREKYFYFEETLYYPMDDCEDRAIFYAYLVHEILKLDVHLIQFPGHECTAVAFSQPLESGSCYEHEGKTYYICDPTYIGADIGKCMPGYKNESPQVEVWY